MAIVVFVLNLLIINGILPSFCGSTQNSSDISHSEIISSDKSLATNSENKLAMFDYRFVDPRNFNRIQSSFHQFKSTKDSDTKIVTSLPTNITTLLTDTNGIPKHPKRDIMSNKLNSKQTKLKPLTASLSSFSDNFSGSLGDGNEVVILEKRFRIPLLIEVARFLSIGELTLVVPKEDKERCNKLGRTLYMNQIRTTCTALANLEGRYTAIIFIATETDPGRSISYEMKIFSSKVKENKVSFSHVAVILLSSMTILEPVKTRMRYCIVQPKAEGVEFREVFTFGPDSNVPAQEVVGWWNPLDIVSSSMPLWNELVAPNDFMGNAVRVVYFQNDPEVIITKDAHGNTNIDGYAVDILRILQKQLNFSIEWMYDPTQQYGVELDNGSFTGIVGYLQRREADIAIPALAVLANRIRVMDFSPQVDHGALKLVIYKRATQKNIQWSTYYGGFQGSVWVTLVAFWLIMSLGFFIVSKSEPDITINSSLLIFIGAIAQQGSHIEPKTSLGRVVFISFWLGCLVIYSSYTASLTSQLAVVYYHAPFSNLEQALTKAGYSILIQDGTGYIDSIKGMRHRYNDMDLLVQQWEERPWLKVADDDEGLNLIQSTKEKFAYFKYTRQINDMMKNNCSFSWIGQPYFPVFTHIGFAKDLAYSRILSYYIGQASDTGILTNLNLRWWGKETLCVSRNQQELGFSKTASAFALLAVGTLLALIFFIFERLFHRWQLWKLGLVQFLAFDPEWFSDNVKKKMPEPIKVIPFQRTL